MISPSGNPPGHLEAVLALPDDDSLRFDVRQALVFADPLNRNGHAHRDRSHRRFLLGVQTKPLEERRSKKRC